MGLYYYQFLGRVEVRYTLVAIMASINADIYLKLDLGFLSRHILTYYNLNRTVAPLFHFGLYFTFDF